MKANVSINLIVAIFLSAVIVGFFVLYYTQSVGKNKIDVEVRSQIARCCPKYMEDGLNALCVDDPKLIKAINKKLSKNYKNLAPLKALVDAKYTTSEQIKYICNG